MLRVPETGTAALAAVRAPGLRPLLAAATVVFVVEALAASLVRGLRGLPSLFSLAEPFLAPRAPLPAVGVAPPSLLSEPLDETES